MKQMTNFKSKMKISPIRLIGCLVLGILIGYFLMFYVTMEPNLFLWSEGVRLGMMGVSVFVFFISLSLSFVLRVLGVIADEISDI